VLGRQPIDRPPDVGMLQHEAMFRRAAGLVTWKKS
jgi:hypothetical protein